MTACPTEIKLKIYEFNGTHTQSNRWLKNIIAYLTVNTAIYNNDKKKIVVALSYMSKGAAEKWSKDFLDHTQSINPTSHADVNQRTLYGYGTWVDFVKDFKKSFSPIDI